jgi:hypothetical protein
MSPGFLENANEFKVLQDFSGLGEVATKSKKYGF